MRLIETTTHRKTFKILYYRDLGLGPFYYDPLHRREHYFYCDGEVEKIERWMSSDKRIPSWKMCSKNKKQWMKKKLKFEHWYSVYRDYDYYKITW